MLSGFYVEAIHGRILREIARKVDVPSTNDRRGAGAEVVVRLGDGHLHLPQLFAIPIVAEQAAGAEVGHHVLTIGGDRGSGRATLEGVKVFDGLGRGLGPPEFLAILAAHAKGEEFAAIKAG